MAAQTPAPERAAGRRKLAKAGNALPDGSFPIPNVSYLGKAIRAVGRAAPGKRPALARLIRKRARQLGSAGMAKLKGSWADNTQSKAEMANALHRELLLCGYTHDQAVLELSLTLSGLYADVVELAGYGKKNSDDDSDASTSSDKDKLSPKGRKVYARLLARGISKDKAYNVACYHTPGGMAKAA